MLSRIVLRLGDNVCEWEITVIVAVPVLSRYRYCRGTIIVAVPLLLLYRYYRSIVILAIPLLSRYRYCENQIKRAGCFVHGWCACVGVSIKFC